MRTITYNNHYGSLDNYNNSVEDLLHRLDQLEAGINDPTDIRRINETRELAITNAELKSSLKEKRHESAELFKELVGKIRTFLRTKQDLQAADRSKVSELLHDLERTWKSQNTEATTECVRKINNTIRQINDRQKMEYENCKRHKINTCLGTVSAVLVSGVYALWAQNPTFKCGGVTFAATFLVTTGSKYVYDHCTSAANHQQRRREEQQPAGYDR